MFLTDYDEIKLKKISYDIISVTSSLFYVTETNVTRFSHFGPFPIKISSYASAMQYSMLTPIYSDTYLVQSDFVRIKPRCPRNGLVRIIRTCFAG